MPSVWLTVFRPSATDVHAPARSGALLGEGGSQPWLQVKLMKGDFKKYRCLGAAMDKMNQSPQGVVNIDLPDSRPSSWN